MYICFCFRQTKKLFFFFLFFFNFESKLTRNTTLWAGETRRPDRKSSQLSENLKFEMLKFNHCCPKSSLHFIPRSDIWHFFSVFEMNSFYNLIFMCVPIFPIPTLLSLSWLRRLVRRRTYNSSFDNNVVCALIRHEKYRTVQSVSLEWQIWLLDWNHFHSRALETRQSSRARMGFRHRLEYAKKKRSHVDEHRKKLTSNEYGRGVFVSRLLLTIEDDRNALENSSEYKKKIFVNYRIPANSEI